MIKAFLSKRFCLGFTVVLLGLLGAGCGEEDTSEGASGSITVDTGTLPKAKFIVKADAICRKGNEEVQGGVEAFIQRYGKREYSEPLLVAKAPKLVSTVLAPSFEKQIDQILDLGAPKGDEAEVSAILTAMSDLVDDAEEQPKDFARNGEPFQEPAQLAQSYGLEVCGQP
jgi:hypothetical protein